MSVFVLKSDSSHKYYGLNSFTLMPDPAANKRQALEATGTFNRRFAAVRHELFQGGSFFDPKDLLQVKYETVRAVEKDGYSIARAASEFGLSRPTIYQAQGQLKDEGLQGLLPRKRGPRGARKLTAEVLRFLREAVLADPHPGGRQLSLLVQERFKLEVHPRTIEKALKTQGQKRGLQKK